VAEIRNDGKIVRKRLAMTEEDRLLITEMKGRLPSDVKEHLRRIIIFGSRVAGTATEESDLDVVALVDEKTPEIERKIDDAVYGVMWDHDFRPIISLKVFSESQYKDALDRGFSFYRHVEEEGVSL